MNRTEASSLILVLAAAFPNANIQKETVAVYVENIIDLDYAHGETAVNNLIRSENWFPPVARFRREVLDVAGLSAPPRELAWLEVEREIRRRGHSGSPSFSHDAISEAVKTIGWFNLCVSDNTDVIRAHFFKAYDGYSDRHDRALVTTQNAIASAATLSLPSVIRSA